MSVTAPIVREERPSISRASAVVARRDGATRSDVVRARGAGPLRILTPRSAGRAAWIVTSSLGGGLVDRDEVALDVLVERGATSVVTTEASTKVYKGTTRQTLVVRVADHASAILAPDPLVPFASSTIRQETTIELDPTASIVSTDTLTAGRVAHGERWAFDRVDITLRLLRGPLHGAVVSVHDRVVLDRADAPVAERMREFDALATCVVVGPRVASHARALLTSIARAPLHAPRDGSSGGRVLVAASPIGDDGVLVRICGTSVEEVVAATRSHLRAACAALGEDPWARKW